MIRQVDIRLIDPPDRNFRRSKDSASLRELVDSIYRHGILQSIIIKPTSAGRFCVVAGDRRFTAVSAVIRRLREEADEIRKTSRGRAEELDALRAKRELVPALVLEGVQLDQSEEIQMIENLQRDAVEEIDEAYGLLWLINEKGYTIASLADRLAKTTVHIRERLKLCDAPPAIINALRQRSVSLKTAISIARIPDAGDRERCATEILFPKYFDEPLSTALAEEWIRSHYLNSLKSAPFDLEDGELLPAAGKCSSCPWRAGNDPDIITANPERGLRGTDPNTCLNPSCYRAKCGQVWARIQKEAEAEGFQILDSDTTSRIFCGADGRIAYDSPWIDVDSKPRPREIGHFDARNVPKWRKLIEGLRVPLAMARHPQTGRIHQMARRSLVIEAVTRAASEKGVPSPFARSPMLARAGVNASARRQRQELKDRERDSIDRISSLAEKLAPQIQEARALWVEVAVTAFALHYDSSALVKRWLGIGNHPAALRDHLTNPQVTLGEIQMIAIIALISDDLSGAHGGDLFSRFEGL